MLIRNIITESYGAMPFEVLMGAVEVLAFTRATGYKGKESADSKGDKEI
jgi:hypothetical protein